jgi:hypothetical protein
VCGKLLGRSQRFPRFRERALGYVQQVLQPGEIRYQGTMSWVLYLAPIDFRNQVVAT